MANSVYKKILTLRRFEVVPMQLHIREGAAAQLVCAQSSRGCRLRYAQEILLFETGRRRFHVR